MRQITIQADERWALGMRGTDIDQGGLFRYVSMEERVPAGHPLRRVRSLLDEALKSMNRDFERVYASGGRESVAPGRLVGELVLPQRRSATAQDAGARISQRRVHGDAHPWLS